MALFTRCWVCCLLGTITLVSIMYYTLNIKTLHGEEFASGSIMPLHDMFQEIANDSITPLHDNRTYIIGAYYDNREKSLVRLIAIIHHQDVKELYCWFPCRDTEGHVRKDKAVIDVLAHTFGFPYVVANLLCPEQNYCNPKYVSVHWSAKEDGGKMPMFQIRNRWPETFSAEFTVCISTMFGNSTNALQLIQTIEMYKLLGAKKVMIYRNSCSPVIDKVLQHYITEDTVEVMPWPIHLHLNVSTKWLFSMDPKDIGYYGQLATLNDCIYRNMYRSKYVVLSDLDEIILPKKHHNWENMMNTLQKQNPNIGVFLFENHVFPKNVFDSTFNRSTWKAIPGDNILQHIYREPLLPDHQKMIVNPRKVIQTSVHAILKGYGNYVLVPGDFAILYHCREPVQPKLPRASLIRDTTIWKYSATLIQKIETLKNDRFVF